MRVQNIEVLYKKIVDWAKDQGKIYPEGLQMERALDEMVKLLLFIIFHLKLKNLSLKPELKF